MIYLLSGQLIYWLFSWLTDWPTDRLTDSLTDCFNDILTDWQTDCDWLNERLYYWLTHWLIRWMTSSLADGAGGTLLTVSLTSSNRRMNSTTTSWGAFKVQSVFLVHERRLQNWGGLVDSMTDCGCDCYWLTVLLTEWLTDWPTDWPWVTMAHARPSRPDSRFRVTVESLWHM